MEIPRPTKYILQRGATVVATLSSTKYRRLPLVQDGLEISCCVAIFMPETLKNKEIIQKYKDMVDIMYTETDGNADVGSFVHINIPLIHQKNKSNQTPKESSVSSRKTQKTQSKIVKPSQFQLRLNPRGKLLQKNLEY